MRQILEVLVLEKNVGMKFVCRGFLKAGTDAGPKGCHGGAVGEHKATSVGKPTSKNLTQVADENHSI